MKFIHQCSLAVLILAGIASLWAFEVIPHGEDAGVPYGTIQLPTLETTEIRVDSSAMERTADLSFDDFMSRGQQYVDARLYTEAISEFIAARQMGDNTIAADMALGKTYEKLGQYTKALSHYQQILNKDVDHQETLFQIVGVNATLGQYDAALAVLEKLPGDHPLTIYYRGVVYSLQGNIDGALENLNILTIEGIDPKLKEKANTLKKAFDEFALYRGASQLHLKVLLARSLYEIGYYEMGLRMLEQAIEEKHDYRDAWILFGYGKYVLAEFEDAETAFQTAYDLYSAHVDVQFYLGITKAKLGKRTEAITYLEQARQNQYEPRTEVTKRLADIYIQEEKYQEALPLYQELLNSEGVLDMNYYVRPIWVYIDVLNMPDRALVLAKEALDKNPDDAMAHNLLGWSYLANKDYEAAENYLLLALTKDDSLGAAYLNLGKLYEEQGKIENAKQAYRKAYLMEEGTSVGNLAAELYNALLVQETTEE